MRVSLHVVLLAAASFGPLAASGSAAREAASAYAATLTAEDARRIMEARWAIDRGTRKIEQLRQYHDGAQGHILEQIKKGESYRKTIEDLIGRMRQKRSPAVEIELAKRGLDHVQAYMVKIEQYDGVLKHQVALARAVEKEHERTLSLYDRLKKLGDEVAVVPLDALARLERASGGAEAGVSAKQKELEAAEANVERAKEAVRNAQLVLRASSRSLGEVQAALDAARQRQRDWKGRILDAVKLPVKVVKVPLQMLDDLGRDKGGSTVLSAGDQLLLARCKVMLDEATKLFTVRQVEDAQLEQDLASLRLANTRLEMRIARDLADGVRERVKQAELARKQADADEAAKQAELKKASAARAKAEIEKKRKQAEQERHQLARSLQTVEDNDARTLLEIDLQIAGERVAGLALDTKQVEAEAQLKEDQAKLAELESLLALVGRAGKTTEELAADQSFVARELSNLKHDKAALASLDRDAEGLLKDIETRLAEVREEEISQDGMPSVPEIDSLLLSTPELRETYRVRRGQRRALVQEQLKKAHRIKERHQDRLRMADERLDMLGEAEKKLTARRAEALWASGPIAFSLAAAKAAWKDTRLLCAKAWDWPKKVPALARAWRVKYGLPRLAGIAFAVAAAIAALVAARRLTRKALKWWKDGLKLRSQERWGNRLLLAIPYVLNRSMSVLLFCGVVSAAAVWLVQDEACRGCLLIAAGLFAAFRLLHAIASACFSVHRRGRRVFRWNEHLSRHVHRLLGTALFVTFIFALLTQVLQRVDYSSDVIALCVGMYKLLLIVLLIVFFSHPIFIQKLMPTATTWLGRTVRLALTILYPPMGLFLVVILAMWLAGYRVMAVAMGWTLLWSVALILGAFVLSWGVVHHVRRRYMRSATTGGPPEGMRWGQAVTLTLVVAVAVLVVHLWHARFSEVLWSPAAPATVRIAVVKAAVCKDWLVKFACETKLPLGDKTTTPWQILVGLTVAVLGLFVASLVRKAVDRSTIGQPVRALGAWHTVRSCVYYTALAIVAAVGLMVAGIPLSALSMFAGAFGIGIGFGMRNIISNFISGIIILFERPIKPSDYIDVDDKWGGWVTRIGARSTTIRTRDNINVVVPNSQFIEKTIVNWHGLSAKTRIHVPVGVAYGSDVPAVEACLLKVAADSKHIMADPAPAVWFIGFGESSLRFELIAWVKSPDQIPEITSQLNFAIDDMFRQHAITIPFPQRDLHIRSSVPLPHATPETDRRDVGRSDPEAAENEE